MSQLSTDPRLAPKLECVLVVRNAISGKASTLDATKGYGKKVVHNFLAPCEYRGIERETETMPERLL